MRLSFLLLTAISFSLFFSSCSQNICKKDITIALSYGDKNSSYGKWIKSQDSCINIINLYKFKVDSIEHVLEKCDGLLLTGGADVSPCLYNQSKDTCRCYMHLRRDSIELRAIHKAIKTKIPILGICRGEQILNVALGGSLIVDIPSDIGKDITHRKTGTYNCFHTVKLDTSSILGKLSGTKQIRTNSRHHQAINRISSDLKAIAYSEDGIIEAIQWKVPENKAFLLGLQWHPEQLGTKDSLSTNILKHFISEINNY
jgi:putative glutamine amidotransferase